MDTFSKQLADTLDSELGGTFKNLPKRIRIWSEVDKYNWKEDESVWRQKRGKDAKDYEFYMDGEFVCSFIDRDGIKSAYLRVLEGIRNLYKEGKLFVNEEMYKIKEAEEEEKRKKSNEVELPKAHTPEEKMVAGAIEKMAKKKGKKVKSV
jgi:hypothetical protein